MLTPRRHILAMLGRDCVSYQNTGVDTLYDYVQVSTTSHKGILGLFPPGKKNKQRFVVSAASELVLWHIESNYTSGEREGQRVYSTVPKSSIITKIKRTIVLNQTALC